MVERYMEAEVLRNQLQVATAENARLREEMKTSREEFVSLRPRIAVAEKEGARCTALVADLEAENTSEMANAKSAYVQETSELKARHTQRMAELRAAESEEISQLRAENAEELARFRNSVEELLCAGDAFMREQQDNV